MPETPERPRPLGHFPTLQRQADQCACGGGCPRCRTKGQAGGAHTAQPESAATLVQRVLGTDGQPLDAQLRAGMETRFGHNFADVRVHTDAAAAASAQAVAANAYTVGRNIVFGAGRYAPQTTAGQRLIAHELTHTLQQQPGTAGRLMPSGAPEIVSPHDASEQQADSVAERIASGATVAPLAPVALSAPRLARQPASAAPKKADEHDAPTAEANKDEAKKDDAKKDEAKKDDAPPAGSSPKWPWYVLDKLIVKMPARWSAAYQAAKSSNSFSLIDPSVPRELAHKELMALLNIAHAGWLTQMSPYKPTFSQGIDMAETLSGVSDTWLNLISLGIHYDLNKYLKDEFPAIALNNLGWTILYGLVAQGAFSTANYLFESDDIDFTAILSKGAKKFTDAPTGFKFPDVTGAVARPFQLANVPDPRWSSFFTATPPGLNFKISNWNDPTKPTDYKANLGFNVASTFGLRDDKTDPRKGMELYPYFNLIHSEFKQTPAPGALQNQWLGGMLLGGDGFYPFLEVGGKETAGGQQAESYQRLGLLLRGLGPLDMLQATGEFDERADSVEKRRERVNLAANFNIADSSRWQFNVGGSVGGLLPEGDARGALDVAAQAGLYYKQPGQGSEPVKTGAEVGFSTRLADQFDEKSARLWSGKGSFTIKDLFTISLEYHKVTGEPLNLQLPTEDFRLMFYPGVATFDLNNLVKKK
ncbi:MAG TPA: DUF4157 domain-containing protein [Pyrinomonadaceae bacterium]